MIGLRVLLLHPKVAERPCSDCRRFLYRDSGPGSFGPLLTVRGPGGTRVGAPRPKGTRPPCEWCPKIAPGDEPHPDNGVELSAKNLSAYVYHLQCKAVGEFPRDAIVRRNAALIESALQLVEHVRRASGGENALVTLANLLGR